MKSVKNIYVLFLVLLFGYGSKILEGAAAQAGGGAAQASPVDGLSLEQKNDINSAFQTEVGADGLTQAQREYIERQRTNPNWKPEEREKHGDAWEDKFNAHNLIGNIIKIHFNKNGFQVALDHDVAQELTNNGLFRHNNALIVAKDGSFKVLDTISKKYIKKAQDSIEDYTNVATKHPVYESKANLEADLQQKIDTLHQSKSIDDQRKLLKKAQARIQLLQQERYKKAMQAERARKSLINSIVNDLPYIEENVRGDREAIDKYGTGISTLKYSLDYFIKEKGIDINKIFKIATSKHSNKMLPLVVAAGVGSLYWVNQLIENGADVNAKDGEGDTSLLIASQQKDSDDYVSVVHTLIDNGADVNAKGSNGNAPLHVAVNKENMKIINALIDRGADVNAKNDKEQTPLHFAALKGNKTLVDLLLSKGANPALCDEKGRSPAEWARLKGYIELANYLESKVQQ